MTVLNVSFVSTWEQENTLSKSLQDITKNNDLLVSWFWQTIRLAKTDVSAKTMSCVSSENTIHPLCWNKKLFKKMSVILWNWICRYYETMVASKCSQTSLPAWCACVCVVMVLMVFDVKKGTSMMLHQPPDVCGGTCNPSNL